MSVERPPEPYLTPPKLEFEERMRRGPHADLVDDPIVIDLTMDPTRPPEALASDAARRDVPVRAAHLEEKRYGSRVLHFRNLHRSGRSLNPQDPAVPLTMRELYYALTNHLMLDREKKDREPAMPLPGATSDDASKPTLDPTRLMTPIDIDRSGAEFALSSGERRKFLKEVVEHAMEHVDPGHYDDRMALSFMHSKILSPEFIHESERVFFRDFVQWMRGRPTVAEDIAKTPWLKEGRVNRLPEHMRNLGHFQESVRKFLDMFVSLRYRFETQLEVLRLRGPRNLVEAYLYFKYIVREGCSDYMEDFKLMYMYLGRSGERIPLFESAPTSPAPPGEGPSPPGPPVSAAGVTAASSSAPAALPSTTQPEETVLPRAGTRIRRRTPVPEPAQRESAADYSRRAAAIAITISDPGDLDAFEKTVESRIASLRAREAAVSGESSAAPVSAAPAAAALEAAAPEAAAPEAEAQPTFALGKSTARRIRRPAHTPRVPTAAAAPEAAPATAVPAATPEAGVHQEQQPKSQEIQALPPNPGETAEAYTERYHDYGFRVYLDFNQADEFFLKSEEVAKTLKSEKAAAGAESPAPSFAVGQRRPPDLSPAMASAVAKANQIVRNGIVPEGAARAIFTADIAAMLSYARSLNLEQAKAFSEAVAIYRPSFAQRILSAAEKKATGSSTSAAPAAEAPAAAAPAAGGEPSASMFSATQEEQESRALSKEEKDARSTARRKALDYERSGKLPPGAAYVLGGEDPVMIYRYAEELTPEQMDAFYEAVSLYSPDVADKARRRHSAKRSQRLSKREMKPEEARAAPAAAAVPAAPAASEPSQSEVDIDGEVSKRKKEGRSEEDALVEILREQQQIGGELNRETTQLRQKREDVERKRARGESSEQTEEEIAEQLKAKSAKSIAYWKNVAKIVKRMERLRELSGQSAQKASEAAAAAEREASEAKKKGDAEKEEEAKKREAEKRAEEEREKAKQESLKSQIQSVAEKAKEHRRQRIKELRDQAAWAESEASAFATRAKSKRAEVVKKGKATIAGKKALGGMNGDLREARKFDAIARKARGLIVALKSSKGKVSVPKFTEEGLVEEIIVDLAEEAPEEEEGEHPPEFGRSRSRSPSRSRSASPARGRPFRFIAGAPSPAPPMVQGSGSGVSDAPTSTAESVTQRVTPTEVATASPPMPNPGETFESYMERVMDSDYFKSLEEGEGDAPMVYLEEAETIAKRHSLPSESQSIPPASAVLPATLPRPMVEEEEEKKEKGKGSEEFDFDLLRESTLAAAAQTKSTVKKRGREYEEELPRARGEYMDADEHPEEFDVERALEDFDPDVLFDEEVPAELVRRTLTGYKISPAMYLVTIGDSEATRAEISTDMYAAIQTIKSGSELTRSQKEQLERFRTAFRNIARSPKKRDAHVVIQLIKKLQETLASDRFRTKISDKAYGEAFRTILRKYGNAIKAKGEGDSERNRARAQELMEEARRRFEEREEAAPEEEEKEEPREKTKARSKRKEREEEEEEEGYTSPAY